MQSRAITRAEPVARRVAGDAGTVARAAAGHERWWVTPSLLLPAVLLLAALALTSCGRPARPLGTAATLGGNAQRGEQALARYGCGACHTIGGVRGAHGKVGPPLDDVAERTILAGEIPNTPENMVKWIRNPQSIEPNTAMPNLGVDEVTARDMMTYLYERR